MSHAWQPEVVSAYYPLGDEPDTLPLLSALAESGFRPALPRTVSQREPLQFCTWRPGEPLVRGAMKIWEPDAQASVVTPDLLFVPLAAFDRMGRRIGFGGGHYDRTLSKLRRIGHIRAVGVAFSVSEVPSAPAEAHDEPLDYVLTENELIDCSDARR